MSAPDIEVSFADFIESFQLPQTIKVTEGVCLSGTDDSEFCNGEVFNLQHKMCPSAVLTFKHPATNTDTSVSVSASHDARFQLEPFDSRRPDLPRGERVLFETVAQLLTACPLLVRARKAYVHPDEPTNRFNAGDRIRLVRITRKFGAKHLECRLLRCNTLLRLPLDCTGDFEVVDDPFYYTVRELIQTLPRQRRLRLAPDIINERNVIPGVPPGFSGEILMERPRFLVLANPAESPGHEMMIPEETAITVSPREDAYLGHLEHEYPLGSFVIDNEGKLPFEAWVTNWEEQTALMERFSVHPGCCLTMLQLSSVPKYILSGSDGQYFIAPRDYNGRFEKCPRVFRHIGELEKLGAMVVRVVEGAASGHPHLYSTVTGTVLQVLTGSPQIVAHKRDCVVVEETEVLLMKLVTKGKQKQEAAVNVPLYLGGTYEEVLQGGGGATMTLSETREEDLPMSVRLTRDPQRSSNMGAREGLPFHEPLRLHGLVQEPCVLVWNTTNSSGSRHQSPAFYLPVTTKILVTFSRRVKVKESLPKVSARSDAVDWVSQGVFERLCGDQNDYSSPEDINQLRSPSPPLPFGRPNKTTSIKQTSRKPLPSPPGDHHTSSCFLLGPVVGGPGPPPPRPPPAVPGRRATTIAKASKTSKTKAHGQVKFKSLPRPVKKAPLPPEPVEQTEDNTDYEDVSGYIAAVKIPDDGNLVGFGVEEMLAFLRLMDASESCIDQCRHLGITGNAFGGLSNDQLEQHGMINNPLFAYYRDCTRVNVFKHVL